MLRLDLDEHWAPPSLEEKVEARIQDYAAFLPPQPNEALPTLSGAPDDMDAISANILLVQSSRWLEFLLVKVAAVEARRIAADADLLIQERLLRHKHGKEEKASVEEHNRLQQARARAAELKAEEVVLGAIVSAQIKVKEAASRTVTRIGTANPGLTGRSQ